MAGQNYTEDRVGIEFVFVQKGRFEMGDLFGEGNPDESPVHEVFVDDFYIGKYSVTRGQWRKVMGNVPEKFDYPKELNLDDNFPMEFVSWFQAQEFIERLNLLTKGNYRLPNEAEWEYAARSGGKKDRWAGTSDVNELGEYAWFDENSGNTIHPVGQKKPNGLGIYDMSGSVHEWVYDIHDKDAYSLYVQNIPIKETSDGFRVFRGGSFHRHKSGMRCSRRFGASPFNDTGHFGFRLARSAK